MTDPGQLKSVKDLYSKGLKQVRLQAILKSMSDKRGLGTDISKNLTEEGFAKGCTSISGIQEHLAVTCRCPA